ncbi:MFS transporter [Syntrophorhabdus aromaticivorans]|jgi:NNP family nitrate/nitrite transporter-like MFS transporter|uniref:MFS transporter n=1 Tax=Syntrophorhabdus aromaticivorans TaxID=328301 RepID=A0A971RZE6_9BACT|nr:MFS transporter [Syntrophorhabdus aromaticivorans]NLW34190.1 MFS transporter [Syntrophorhabdus aromaticivorans]
MARYHDLKGKGFYFILFLWFLWFMNFNVRTIFSPIMPLIEDEFMVSHAQAGGVFIFQSAGYGFSLFFSGFFCGRLGYRKSIIISLIVSSALCFSTFFVKDFSLLYFLSLIFGISTGIYLPSAIPLITEYFSEKTWGRSIAIHDSAASISIFSAPFIALFFLQFVEWRGIFTVFGVIFALAAITFCFASDELKIAGARRVMAGDLIRTRALWIMAILWIFAAGANLGVYFVVPLYLTKELSLSIEYANTVFGISRLGGVVVAISVGFLVDRFSLRKIMCFIMLATGILTILVARGPARSIGLFLFLQASFVTGFFPVGLVCISRMFARETRGMATGLILTIGVTFGWGIIPYLLGLSGDNLSFRFGILLLGLTVMMSSGLTFLLKELK